jgi:hypothetical protein
MSRKKVNCFCLIYLNMRTFPESIQSFKHKYLWLNVNLYMHKISSIYKKSIKIFFEPLRLHKSQKKKALPRVVLFMSGT